MDGLVYGFFDEGGRPDQVEANKTASKSGSTEAEETAETAVQASAPQWGTYMGNNRRTGWASDRDDPTETDADSEHRENPSEFKLTQNYRFKSNKIRKRRKMAKSGCNTCYFTLPTWMFWLAGIFVILFIMTRFACSMPLILKMA